MQHASPPAIVYCLYQPTKSSKMHYHDLPSLEAERSVVVVLLLLIELFFPLQNFGMPDFHQISETHAKHFLLKDDKWPKAKQYLIPLQDISPRTQNDKKQPLPIFIPAGHYRDTD